MKKFKNLSFALYLVAVVLVVVGAVIFTSTNNKNDTNNNYNNTNNSNSTMNSTTNDLNFTINCSKSYTIYVDSVLIFNNGFYSCNKNVDIKLNSEDDYNSASFIENKFSATKEGSYSISFYVNNTLQESIIINVINSNKNTVFSLGDSLNLEDYKDNVDSTYNLSGNNFAEENNLYTATSAGCSKLEITTKINEFVTKIDKFILKVAPFVKIYNSNYEEMTNQSLVVYTNDNSGIFIIEVITDINNPVPYKVDASGSSNINILNQEPIFVVTNENNVSSGEILLIFKVNDLTTNIAFTINFVEEGN